MALVPLSGPAHEPVSLAEAKAHLRVSGTSEDLLIASLITAARVHLEMILASGFVTQTWSWFLDEWPRRIHLDLPLGPARSVIAIRVLGDGGVVTTLPASSYVLSRSSPPRLTRADRQPWSRGAPGPASGASGIEIEVVAGYGDDADDVPRPIRQAVLLLVARWYEQRVPVDVGREASEMPPEIAALIAPYQQVRL